MASELVGLPASVPHDAGAISACGLVLLFLFSFFTWGMGIHTRVLRFVQQAPFRTEKSPQPPLCLYCFFLSSPTDAAEQTLRICLLVLFRTSEGTFSKFLLFIHC